jgi:hypothetical protein
MRETSEVDHEFLLGSGTHPHCQCKTGDDGDQPDNQVNVQ